jgi:hypothetical protein
MGSRKDDLPAICFSADANNCPTQNPDNNSNQQKKLKPAAHSLFFFHIINFLPSSSR